jgi:molybdopterin-guanine dinucleotide biosynthesis protein A
MAIPARFAGFGLPVAADGLPGHPGPAGRRAGRDRLGGGCSAARRMSSPPPPTRPSSPKTSSDRRCGAAEGAPLALRGTPDETGSSAPAPDFRALAGFAADDLRAALEGGLRKVVLWTDPHGCAVAAFPAGPPDPFFNVNTPQDLRAAEALL